MPLETLLPLGSGDVRGSFQWSYSQRQCYTNGLSAAAAAVGFGNATERGEWVRCWKSVVSNVCAAITACSPD